MLMNHNNQQPVIINQGAQGGAGVDYSQQQPVQQQGVGFGSIMLGIFLWGVIIVIVIAIIVFIYRKIKEREDEI